MITGFNTDVEHGGVVYHVQTEDKGLDSPIILSLVYSGGAILASKRAPYEDLLAAGFSEAALAERLKRQHRLICAAIHAGRIDDLKKMSTAPVFGTPSAPVEDETALEAPTVPESPAPPVEQLDFQIETPLQALEAQSQNPQVEPPPAQFEPPPPAVEPPPPAEPVKQRRPSVRSATPPPTPVEAPPPAPPVEPVPPSPPPQFGMETIYEPAPKNPFASFANETIYEPAPNQVHEPAAPETVYAPVGNETIYEPAPDVSPDSYSISDNRRESPLGDIPAGDQGLIVSLLDEHEFRSGDTVNVRIMVTQRSGEFEKPLNNVSISLKVLGTTFRPQIYSTKTQRNGLATIATQIPMFTSGRAAILVRAVAGSQATEIRRVVHPGR